MCVSTTYPLCGKTKGFDKCSFYDGKYTGLEDKIS